MLSNDSLFQCVPNHTQCEALCCAHQSLQSNPIASHAKHHILQIPMVNRVICFFPVQHHDDAISVGINQAVDQHNVVPDVSARNERALWGWTQCGHGFPQPPCKHVGVNLVVCIQECDGSCITNGSRLVVVGDESHLSLFPWLWHPHMSLFPNHHKSTHHQCPYLVPELHLEAISAWWLPNTVSSMVIGEEGFQFTDVLMHSLFSFSLWMLIILNSKPYVMMHCIVIMLNECYLMIW